MVSGEAFLTTPNKTTYMIQKIIKKITRVKPKFKGSISLLITGDEEAIAINGTKKVVEKLKKEKKK